MRLFLITLFLALPFSIPAYSWAGPITTSPSQPKIDGQIANVTLRVTSMGNLLMHEMTTAGRADDPITTFYLDSDRLTLTHYCDAGNRPRMIAKLSDDANRIEFDFVDVAGSTQYGHMHHAVFTFVDADHHREEWTFMTPGDKRCARASTSRGRLLRRRRRCQWNRTSTRLVR